MVNIKNRGYVCSGGIILRYLILLLLCNICFAQEQIVDFEEKSLPVLNEELRQIDVDIDDNTSDITDNKGGVMMDSSDTLGYLGTKVKNSIENDSDDLQLVGDESAPGNSKYYGTSAIGAKGWETYTDTNNSNVVFCWSGVDIYSANGYGIYVGGDADINADNVGLTGYQYLVSDSATYQSLLKFKFKKIAGISTIAVYARLKSFSSLVAVYCNVSIGGQSAAVNTTSKSWAWATAANINVSGLTNGTVYDGVVQIKSGGEGGECYCSAVTLIGS